MYTLFSLYILCHQFGSLLTQLKLKANITCVRDTVSTDMAPVSFLLLDLGGSAGGGEAALSLCCWAL